MEIDSLIELAIKEDLPQGDLTTESLGISDVGGRAQLIAKADVVLSGFELFSRTLAKVDSNLEVNWHFEEADFALMGQRVATISGNLVSLIKAERIALNFLGRLSGVASFTQKYVNEVKGTNCKILDTRKTTPLYRSYEKQAVVHGGGTNHRKNLSDAILIKENHISLAGGIDKAVKAIRSNSDKSIELEVKTLEEVQIAIDCQVSHLLLDNMDDNMMAEIVKMAPKNMLLEASGNMTLERVKRVANLGVDFISVGALTHSAPCADFSLLFDWKS